MSVGSVDTLVAAQWDDVLSSLRDEIGEAAFQSWLKPMTVREMTDGQVRISVPTRFMKDWVIAHYVDRLGELWSNINTEVKDVEVFVQADYGRSDEKRGAKSVLSSTPTAPTTAVPSTLSSSPSSVSGLSHTRPHSGQTHMAPARMASAELAQVRPANDTALEISAPLDTRYTFDNFVVGKPNEFAYAAAKRVAESPTAQFNPLFLYGGVGLGKTHLMHAIAWRIREVNPNRTVIYMSAEKFMYRFIRALRDQNTFDFKDQFRNVDVLMIDDVQFISGKDSTQEEFFHTFNALVDQGRQIVISADKSPSDLEGMEERLKSRLNCGLVADIHATNYELRLGILQTKAERMGVDVPIKVMEFIAHKITSNVRELEGALNRVAAHASLVGRDITLESVQDVLHDLIRAHDRRVTIEEIQKKVAAHFNIRTSDMHSARRARSVARPRQVAMY
ncbi:MAG: chromosomal replication initiator protein DnaA, partial [Magnetovibrio sp.]|nr:chromosomal replication initiator protein DnaA [Magnetovibrio sp.]